MSERCICEDYEIRGKPYELWVDGSDNWWLQSAHHKQGWVLTEDDFSPPLTYKEIDEITQYIHDYLTE